MARGLENERVGDGYYMRRRDDSSFAIGTVDGPVELSGNAEAFLLDMLHLLHVSEVERIIERVLEDKYADGTDPLYACVNKLNRQQSVRGEKYYVLGEDACAYREPVDIADVYLDMVQEFDHNLTTARVFRLVPVASNEMYGWLEEARKERD